MTLPSCEHFRIGAVSYLNTKPLVYRLAELAPQSELGFDLPSRLADRLGNGEFDVALIPSIETLQSDTYAIISDACIACRGAVWSVRLLSRVPFDEVRKIAMDEGSRTSVALTAILFDQHFKRVPETSHLPIDRDPLSVDTDAVLIIGDRAMNCSSREFPYDWDLGEQWTRLTGLPFVFAMWTARREANLNGLEFQLAQARDAGLEELDAIAREESQHYNLTFEQCLTYLRDHLHFQLGPRECEGLALFRQYAVQMGLAPTDVDINFYDCKAT